MMGGSRKALPFETIKIDRIPSIANFQYSTVNLWASGKQFLPEKAPKITILLRICLKKRQDPSESAF
jgi:hypothetical protein